MSSFTIFAEIPCATLQTLRAKGITQNSDYMQSLEAACSQKTKPKVLTSEKNVMKIVSISTAIVGLITTLILINKKK